MEIWNSEASSLACNIKRQCQITHIGYLRNHKVEKVDFCLKSIFPRAWEEEQQWNSAKGGGGDSGGEFFH